ncbi:uncharacterized membrane protein YkvA (DUF1232 family) [Deinococcus metalli]|uniref:Uncharacterized membrane protein YkvA (DUF1232 family) n=1 Tax=Deinococcus metalli TaxID=1141878 RepID=A0A7W8KEF3_9DEIO|nr:DUF1232 domain-containing protein [Deinococcus metalli]MBB5376228.1 uncharacterized membrane protein YkvA (DUF1232 family) [Deinococcus metalli]GHF39827.1 hypothetical protein GCM10017781_15540 [Deinococcus metalli]
MIFSPVLTRLRPIWRDALALLYAVRDRRTPDRARWIAAGALLYALSPVDLLPDGVPLLGMGDDLVIVPALLAYAARGLPAPVLADARARSARLSRQVPWLLPALVGLLVVGAVLAVWGLLRLARG